jgi:hypothetical protein
MPSSGTLLNVALVRTNVSEEHVAFIITVTRVGEFSDSVTLMMEAIRSVEMVFLTRATQTVFYTDAAVKTSKSYR